MPEDWSTWFTTGSGGQINSGIPYHAALVALLSLYDMACTLRLKLMRQLGPDILIHENVRNFPHEKMTDLLGRAMV